MARKNKFSSTQLRETKDAIREILRRNIDVDIPGIAEGLNRLGIRQPNIGAWTASAVQSFTHRKMGGIDKLRARVLTEEPLPLYQAQTGSSTSYTPPKTSAGTSTERLSLAGLIMGLNFPDEQKELIIRTIFNER